MLSEHGKINHQKRNILLLLYLFISIQMTILLFTEREGTVAADIVSLIVYASMLILIYYYEPEILLKYLWLIIISTWGIIAVFMLENGNVLLRGNRSTHQGSLPMYCFGWLFFWGTILWKEINHKVKLSNKSISANHVEIDVSKNDIQVLKIISYIAIIWVGICFLSIADRPYFLYRIDRFQYKQNLMPWIVSGSMTILYALLPIPIMLRKENKKIPIIYCGIFILLNVWCGEKFTGLIVIFYFIVLSINPSYVTRQVNKYIRKILVVIGIIVCILLIVVGIQQLILGMSTNNIGNYFEDRIAAQGELWWLTYSKDVDAGMHLNEMSDEIDILIHQPEGEMSDYYFGIYKLMKLFMNPEWVTYALANGVRATESTRATFFYYGKIPGLIIGQFLLALLLYFIVNKIIEVCNRRNWLHACLYIHVLRIVITVAIMSDFQLLTTKRIIVVYFMIVLTSKLKFVFWKKI